MLTIFLIGALHAVELQPVQPVLGTDMYLAAARKRTAQRSKRKTPVAAAPAAAAMPADVTRFIDRRAACDHLRGEEPYDPERAEFLDKAINENCSGTDKELRLLRKRYAKNPVIKAKLAKYEDDVEEGPAED
jgi:hypothetical protein